MLERISIKNEILKNGLQVVSGKLPFGKSQYMGFWVKAGSSNEDRHELYGASHFLEHMLFNGSKNFPNFSEVRNKTTELGIHENAWTWLSVTHYHMVTPMRNFQFAFEVLFDRVNYPILSAEMVEKEKGIIIAERKMNDNDPESVLSDAMSESVFNKTSYAHPVLGYEETINGMTATLLKEYHRAFYVPNNLMFLTYGPMDFDEIRPLIMDKLETLKYKDLPKHNIINSDEGLYKKEIKLKLDVETSFYQIALKMPSIKSIKDHSIYALLNAILSRGRASILNQRLRLEKSLVSSFSFDILGFRDLTLLTAGASMDQDKSQLVADIIKEEIENILEGKFSKADFDRAKGYLEGAYLSQFEDAEVGCGGGLSNIFRLNFINDTDFLPVDMVDSIRNLTKEEFVSFCRENIDLDEIVEGFVADKKVDCKT